MSLLKSTLFINMAHIWKNIRKYANMSLSLQMCWNMYTYDVKFTNVCKTWDLTLQSTENEVKYKIELKSVYLTWKISNITQVYVSLLKSTVCINMLFLRKNILKCTNMSFIFYKRVQNRTFNSTMNWKCFHV